MLVWFANHCPWLNWNYLLQNVAHKYCMGLDCRAITTKYYLHVHLLHVQHVLCNALIQVIYSVVSCQYSYAIPVCLNSARMNELIKFDFWRHYRLNFYFALPSINNETVTEYYMYTWTSICDISITIVYTCTTCACMI